MPKSKKGVFTKRVPPPLQFQPEGARRLLLVDTNNADALMSRAQKAITMAEMQATAALLVDPRPALAAFAQVPLHASYPTFDKPAHAEGSVDAQSLAAPDKSEPSSQPGNAHPDQEPPKASAEETRFGATIDSTANHEMGAPESPTPSREHTGYAEDTDDAKEAAKDPPGAGCSQTEGLSGNAQQASKADATLPKAGPDEASLESILAQTELYYVEAMAAIEVGNYALAITHLRNALLVCPHGRQKARSKIERRIHYVESMLTREAELSVPSAVNPTESGHRQPSDDAAVGVPDAASAVHQVIQNVQSLSLGTADRATQEAEANSHEQPIVDVECLDSGDFSEVLQGLKKPSTGEDLGLETETHTMDEVKERSRAEGVRHGPSEQGSVIGSQSGGQGAEVAGGTTSTADAEGEELLCQPSESLEESDVDGTPGYVHDGATIDLMSEPVNESVEDGDRRTIGQLRVDPPFAAVNAPGMASASETHNGPSEQAEQFARQKEMRMAIAEEAYRMALAADEAGDLAAAYQYLGKAAEACPPGRRKALQKIRQRMSEIRQIIDT